MSGIGDYAGTAGGTPTVPLWEAQREAYGFYMPTAPSLQPADFEDVSPQQRSMMVAYLRGLIPDLTAARAQDYVDLWAASWQQDTGSYPKAADAFNDPGFAYGAMKLPTWADQLPEVFIVYGQDGNPVLYDNTTYAGPVPVEVPQERWPTNWRAPTDYEAEHEGLLGLRDPANWQPELPSGIPIITEAELAFVQSNYSAPSGGYGSGAGRTAPTFDRRSLEENIRGAWQSLLLETPGRLTNLVDAYIQEATSFYLETGVQTNLNAWLLEQMRATPRYRLLYGNKPAGMSEDEYLGRVQSVVGRFGFDANMAVRETVKGMSSPVNLSSFAERLSNTRQYQTSHLGDLSQAFANTFNGLAVLRES